MSALRCTPLRAHVARGYVVALSAAIVSACHHAVLDDPGRTESGEHWAERRAAELRQTPQCTDVVLSAELRGVYLVVNCGAVRYMQCFVLPIGGFQCLWIAPPSTPVAIGEAQSPNASSTQTLDELRVSAGVPSAPVDSGSSDASD